MPGRSAFFVIISLLSTSAAEAQKTPDPSAPIPFMRSDGKWGAVNKDFCWVIEPQFDSLAPFFDGLALIQVGNNIIDAKFGHVDYDGRVVIKPQYIITLTSSFSEGFAKVFVGDKWGFIDKSGKISILPVFDSVSDFSEGLAVVKKNGRYGFIDQQGNVVLEFRFEDASLFSEGFAPVKFNGKWGFIDKNGNFAIKPQFDSAGSFSEGLAQVYIARKGGYINRKGQFEINPLFDIASEFRGGFAYIAEVKIVNGVPKFNYGFINKNGDFLVEPKFSNAFYFSEGYASVVLNDKMGFIDQSGKMVISPRFVSGLSAFVNNIATVYLRSSNKKAQINKLGETLPDPKCRASK